MPRLSKEKRVEVTELLKKGFSLRSVAMKMNTTASTIHRLMKKHKATGSVEDRPRSGRPRIMPANEGSWFECVGIDRPFVCTECGKTFRRMSGLKKHIKIHEEREYQCDRCGRGFVTPDALNRHQRSHTGEKPFICEYCARGFADAGTMRTHIRTHTGERPHKCHLCDHACATAGNLHSHMKVHRDKEGCIPRPINVKLPIAKSVPIFSRKDILKNAKIRYEKNNGECWADGDDDYLGKDSEPSLNEEEASMPPYKTMNVLQHERDMFTYSTSAAWNCHEQCSGEDDTDSIESSYKVLVKQDADVSKRVKQVIYSETVGASVDERSCTQYEDSSMQEGIPCTQEEESCTQEEESCVQEEEFCTQEGESCMEEEDDSFLQEEDLCTQKESCMKEETCTSVSFSQEKDLCSQKEFCLKEETCAQKEKLREQEEPCTLDEETCISGESRTSLEDIKEEPTMTLELTRTTLRLSKIEREEAIELLKSGHSLRFIAKKMNTTASTIHRLMKKHKATGSVEDRPRSGRPRIMPANEGSWFECVGIDRPFVCTECSKTFRKMTGLKRHIKIHKEREYQCDRCGRGFVTPDALNRHQRSHTGEKPFICEYCARGFADAGTMRTHIRTHTGERPHKCHLCDHACATAGNLHAHMKVHRDKEGRIPRPINVKLPIAKSVPIFSRKDILKNAQIHIEKNNWECWLDGNDSSRKDSELSLKEEEDEEEEEANMPPYKPMNAE